MERQFETTMKKFLEDYEKGTDEDYAKQFVALKALSQKYKESNRYPVNTGQIAINKKKNRFKDILPYEYTRVALHPVEGVEGSDYINANYVSGADGNISYIAAQGPLPNTVEDFWRMLWYHNIEVIVMACREVEMGKKKCEKYWPTIHQSTDAGPIRITSVCEENMSNDFVVRDFLVECQGEKQNIRQYHYNAWPDHGRPVSPDPIIKMIELINDFRTRRDVPLVIHCSAGCGRTGTLIGIDIAREQLLSNNVPPDFSVYKIVEKMRQQRASMVQAKDQYIFVYMAIAELSKRAIGLSPTLPPKPTMKPPPTAPGKSYINVDLDDLGAPGTSTPSSPSSSPRSLRANAQATIPTPQPLPHPSKNILEKHMYQNVQMPSPTTHSSSSSSSISSSDNPDEPEINKAQKIPPLTSQHSVSNSTHPLPVDRSVSREVGMSQLPMPKPRSKSKKSNGVVSAPAQNSSPSIPVTNPILHTPLIPPPVAQATTRPLNSTKIAKVELPGIVPRIKIADVTMIKQTDVSPPTEGKPTLKSRGDSPPPVPLSPRHTKKLLPLTPCLPTSSPSITPADDVDEFGYGVVNFDRDVDGEEDKKKKASFSPARRTSNSPARRTSNSPASGGEGNTSSIMDTFKDILGEEVMSSVEKKTSPPPLPPPNLHSSQHRKPPNITTRPLPYCPPMDGSISSLNEVALLEDDQPPMIPFRTNERLELIECAPTYDMPGRTNSDMNTTSLDQVDLASVHVRSHSPNYEQPTLFSSPVMTSKSLGSNATMFSPTPASTATVGHNTHSMSNLSGKSTKFGNIFSKKSTGKKVDVKNKNSGHEDSSGHSSTMPSSLPTLNDSSQTSLDGKKLDEKYHFPGVLGFGIRLDRPVGPRKEPDHWKTIPLPRSIKVT